MTWLRVLLRTVLIARCAASLVFVAWMSATAPSFDEVLEPFAWFAGVDGLLSLAQGILSFGIPLIRRALAMVAVLDGVWLVAASATLLYGPGVPVFGLTLVLYVSLAAVFAFFVGLLKITGARRLQNVAGSSAVTTALYVAGIASAAFGVAIFFIQPSAELLRHLLAIPAGIEGLVFLTVAVLRWPEPDGPPRIVTPR